MIDLKLVLLNSANDITYYYNPKNTILLTVFFYSMILRLNWTRFKVFTYKSCLFSTRNVLIDRIRSRYIRTHLLHLFLLTYLISIYLYSIKYLYPVWYLLSMYLRSDMVFVSDKEGLANPFLVILNYRKLIKLMSCDGRQILYAILSFQECFYTGLIHIK